jgi:hypothetical protein
VPALVLLQTGAGRRSHWRRAACVTLDPGGVFAVERRRNAHGARRRACRDGTDARTRRLRRLGLRRDVDCGDIAPKGAGTYEFKAFLVDVPTGDDKGVSNPVETPWADPPRPHDFEFFVNGKKQAIESLTGGDEYFDTPVGDLQAEARWKTDVGGTGYKVLVRTAIPARKTYATCTSGTACKVPAAVEIREDMELTWEVHVVTAQDGKLVDGFKVCLIGRRA